jgi:hypothetical protein
MLYLGKCQISSCSHCSHHFICPEVQSSVPEEKEKSMENILDGEKSAPKFSSNEDQAAPAMVKKQK